MAMKFKKYDKLIITLISPLLSMSLLTLTFYLAFGMGFSSWLFITLVVFMGFWSSVPIPLALLWMVRNSS